MAPSGVAVTSGDRRPTAVRRLRQGATVGGWAWQAGRGDPGQRAALRSRGRLTARKHRGPAAVASTPPAQPPSPPAHGERGEEVGGRVTGGGRRRTCLVPAPTRRRGVARPLLNRQCHQQHRLHRPLPHLAPPPLSQPPPPHTHLPPPPQQPPANSFQNALPQHRHPPAPPRLPQTPKDSQTMKRSAVVTRGGGSDDDG